MKRNIINSILAITMALCTVGCEDLLTQEDPNNPNAETFYGSLADVEQTLTSVYAAMRNEDIYQLRYEAFRSDMAWPGAGRPVPNSQGTHYNIYTHDYNYTSSWINDKWDACYTGIYRANQTIEALESLLDEMEDSDDVEDWTLLMAQARFFRGMLHFYLHSAFNKGSIIIVDSVPVDHDDFNRGLSTSEEVMEFFREDLQYAYENLPIEYSNVEEDLGRVTSGAAANLLGTSYLYEYSDTKDERALSAAMELFRYVINDCGYELMQSGDDLFTEANEMNKESIFEIAYDGSTQTEMGDWDAENFTQYIAYYTCQYNTGHYLPAWLTSAYRSEPIDELNSRNLYEQVIDTATGESETQVRKTISLRASAMVALLEDVYTPWYLEACVPAVTQNFSYSACGFGFYKKFTDCKTLSDDIQKSGMNVVINRLSEVYLMYAECLIYQGDITSALRYMNIIRERWGLVLLGQSQGDGYTYDEYTYDQSTLLNQLQTVDKPLECSLEGHMMRWLDLRRWGLLESNFKKLSESVYYAVNPTTLTDYDGTTYTKNGYGVIYNASQMATDPQTSYETVDFEYDMSYLTFDYDTQAWYPIPLEEIENNSSITTN